MRSSRRHFMRASTLTAALVAAGAIALACSVQSDTPTASTVKAPNANRTSGYFEFTVKKQAAAKPGNLGPRYPDALRRAGVEGSVVAQFVVNADGTPDVDTFKVLKSSDPLFTNAIKQSLATMKFYPAQVDGHSVRQLVTMPFVFALSK